MSLILAFGLILGAFLVSRSTHPVIQQTLCMLGYTSKEMIACVLDSTCRSPIQRMRSCDDPALVYELKR